jgi:hypothetical protein
MKFAYADPPYYKQGKKLYGKLHDEAAVWDAQQAHWDLVDRLMVEYPDGWALSCNPADLPWIIKHDGIRICVWVKTFHQIRHVSIQYAWEPVLIYGGRKENKRKPMVRDWMSGRIAMRKGLVGAKPDDFNQWILQLLNYQNGDQFDDLFPGTNGMAEAIARKNASGL